MTRPLDELDRAILAALQQDGRIANVALAKQIGLSPTACSERVKALEADGVIRGYRADLDAERLGYGLLAFITVSLNATAQDVFDRFRAEVAAIPEILECHMVAGGFDYILKVRVTDMAAYRAFLGSALSRLANIRETRTYPVMEEVKETGAVPLPDPRAPRARY